MVRINGNKIMMTRGDTAKAIISIVDSNGKPYVPADEDKIVFTAREKYGAPVAAIRIVIPNDTLLLEI